MTATQLRTAHSSYVNLDPTEYRYVGAFDSSPEPGSFRVERSDRDDSFGFFKRPTKATVLNEGK